jgi:hypothetical protein
MSKENQDAWPRTQRDGSGRTSPTAIFQAPGLTEKSGRSVAGPLRLGTSPGAGPSGAVSGRVSDHGMDRVSPRGFDPLGTSDTRAPAQEASETISGQARRK